MQRFVNPRARARTATNDFGATFTDSPVRVARGKRREKNSRRSSLLAFIYKASQVQLLFSQTISTQAPVSTVRQ